MQFAARPYLTAGATLVGASAIVASSIAPLPAIGIPDIHLPAVSVAGVNLAASGNPLDAYAQVLQNLVANVDSLASAAHPGQVLRQIFANQLADATGLGAALQTTGADLAQVLTTLPALVRSAVGQLAAGNIAGAVSTLLTAPVAVAFPLTNLLPALATALTTPVRNLVNVVNAFLAPANLLQTELDVAGLIAPLISTPAAVALAVQNVIGAITKGNPAGVLGALLTAPATIADGILNGGIGPDLGPLVAPTLGIPVFAGGLFSSAFVNGANGFFVNTGGPIYALEQVLNTITAALKAPAAAAAVKPVRADPASIPATTTAATITLKTGSGAVNIPAKSMSSTAVASPTARLPTPPSLQVPQRIRRRSPITLGQPARSRARTLSPGRAPRKAATLPRRGLTPRSKGGLNTHRRNRPPRRVPVMRDVWWPRPSRRKPL